jgi:hypothetical protein
MKNYLIIFAVCILSAVAIGQSNKDWRTRTAQEANKLLNDSPWAHVQTDTDTSEMFFSPTRPGVGSINQDTLIPGRPVREQSERNNNRADRGALNQAVSVDYYIRFFSARPVREAIARIVLLNSPEPGPKMIKEWQDFVERDFGPYIVVTVTCASPDGRLLGPTLQAFNSATPGTLKNTTYLERKDGKRVYLTEYRPPEDDGIGAKFIFPRFVNGERFLTAPEGAVRFVTEIGTAVKINSRFDLTQMILADRLEY